MKLNATQKLILLEIVSNEKELSGDKEDFLTDSDWKNYNENLQVILDQLKEAISR